MEPEAVASLRDTAGKNAAPPPPSDNDLFEQDGKGYLEWLDAQAAGSVVYISFGSLSVMSKRQIEEVARGMAESGRPFLWVLRKDNRSGKDGDAGGAVGGGERGMVVEWCDQVRVLSHPAVGCFVAHCEWNSTLEAWCAACRSSACRSGRTRAPTRRRAARVSALRCSSALSRSSTS
ncbi:hypothetical protein ACP70R_031033 [Stipagrostis hirtigluma subsp. patula]